MTPTRDDRRRGPAYLPVALAALLASIAAPSGAAAHGPDPALGGALWSPNQAVTYTWKAGQAPPAWLATAIDAAAADASATRGSRAATFARQTGAASLIAYGEPTGCSSAGIACFDRSAAPASFRMWFRAHNYAFDWGVLRWCQAQDPPANGCFDAETVALDEFGHVEGLGHHANFADQSDYLDAVVQTVSRSRPADGWDAHAFMPCDTARLQLLYERPDPAAAFSSCLAVASATTLSASATSIWTGTTVTFTASLAVTTSKGNGALSGDPVSDRVVVLQRRTGGTGSWITIGTMSAHPTIEGRYVLNASPTATYEWRAVFTTVAGEGLAGSSSSAVKVSVSGCTGSGCPSRAVP